MNIQDGIDKEFGSIERAYSIVVYAYFGPRCTNRPHATPNYGPVTSKFDVEYYRQTCCSPEKVFSIRKKL